MDIPWSPVNKIILQIGRDDRRQDLGALPLVKLNVVRKIKILVNQQLKHMIIRSNFYTKCDLIKTHLSTILIGKMPILVG